MGVRVKETESYGDVPTPPPHSALRSTSPHALFAPRARPVPTHPTPSARSVDVPAVRRVAIECRSQAACLEAGTYAPFACGGDGTAANLAAVAWNVTLPRGGGTVSGGASTTDCAAAASAANARGSEGRFSVAGIPVPTPSPTLPPIEGVLVPPDLWQSDQAFLASLHPNYLPGSEG